MVSNDALRRAVNRALDLADESGVVMRATMAVHCVCGDEEDMAGRFAELATEEFGHPRPNMSTRDGRVFRWETWPLAATGDLHLHHIILETLDDEGES